MNNVGFLLVEMVCSLLILSFFSLVFAYGYRTMLFIQHDSVRRLKAITVLQNYSERVLCHGVDASGALAPDDLVTITNERISTDQPGFSVLKIKASWPSLDGTQHTMTVSVGSVHALS